MTAGIALFYLISMFCSILFLERDILQDYILKNVKTPVALAKERYYQVAESPSCSI